MQDLRAQLEEVESPLERLTPGSVVPAGECPDCGSLAYIDNKESRAKEHALELLEALKEAKEFIASLLDSNEEEAVDLLTNSGEDVSERIHAAIEKTTGKATP